MTATRLARFRGRIAGTMGAVAVAAWFGTAWAAEDAPGRTAPVDFAREVRPILAENCFACHGPDPKQRKADLRLDVSEGAVGAGAVIVPGHADDSAILFRLAEEDPALRMPPPETGKHLSPREIETLRAWIDQGARWTGHWSFVAPGRPDPPKVADISWPRNAIDRFLLARLEAEGLRPALEADRATLIRRVTLDLTGLPPAPAEVDAFLSDPAADAYEKVVDRLLASPHYGERMALEWLDAARYADTHGFHRDGGRDMTRWRDWVIEAFNRNLPFDRFTIEQIAGDLLTDATLDQKIASGFHRNHMINIETGAVPEEYLAAYVADRVNTTGTVWLGLTLGCAQCHDHKFDPITQKEYYQLSAFFNNVPENGIDGAKGNAEPVLKLPAPAQQQELDRLAAAIAQAVRTLADRTREVDAAQAAWEATEASGPSGADGPPEAIRAILALPASNRNDAQKKELTDWYRARHAPDLERIGEPLVELRRARTELDETVPTTMIMREMPEPRGTFVLARGQYDQRGERVEPGVPASLPPLPEGGLRNRLGLARWLVDPVNPLTARVIVNRYWQVYFGAGLVATAEDFGSQGEWPSHPELLDWLAAEFVASGWDVKRMQRLIVTSATYLQSSVVTPTLLEKDPENRLLARGPRVRLPAEIIRDQALAASGLLDHEVGGRSVFPYQPAALWEELFFRLDGANFSAQAYVQGHGKDLYRRSLYTFWKRASPPPGLAILDAPTRETCTVRRSRTNTPLQALLLLNDPTFVEASRKLAERMMAEAASPDDRIATVYRLVLARRPSPDEQGVLSVMFDEQVAVFRRDAPAALRLLGVGESGRDETRDAAELAAWTVIAGVILNLDETLTRG